MLLRLPEPYSFELSTERFRAFGRDLANVWHEGGLHRVVAGQEVRLEPADGGVRVSGAAPGTTSQLEWLLGAPFDLVAFEEWAAQDPVLRAVTARLRGFRPPLAADPWEMLVGSITAQQVSLFAATAIRNRLIERFGVRHRRAWEFPTREQVAAADESELVALGFSRRKAEYVVGLARTDLDLDALRELPHDAVKAAISSQRGLGEWTADWFLARHLARPRAWPAGDLGLRKAVSAFYAAGGSLSTEEVRALAARFDPFQNLTAHYLLLGLRAP